jgi:hypothetical protein
MNRFKLFLKAGARSLVAGLLLAVTAVANAQTRENFANTGTAIGSTNSHYVIPVSNLGKPIVTYLNGTSDKAGSVLQFWKAQSGAQTLTIATNASQAIVYVPSGSSFAANDVVVIQHKTSDSYERRIVSAQTSTNITLTVNLTSAIVAGDQIYKMTQAGSIPVGNATKEITTVGVYNAPPGLPVLVDLDGTSACKINLISGYYSP